MSILPIIYAPNLIFKKKAALVEKVDDKIKELSLSMLSTAYHHRALGLGANMVGILLRIAVVDLQIDGVKDPKVFVNPQVIVLGNETQVFMEASLSFPGIEALITRAKNIKVNYLDLNGESKTEEFSGFFATVIQHEVDYLDGKVFLDHLSKLKQDLLLKKMQKFIRHNPPHVHGEHCSH